MENEIFGALRESGFTFKKRFGQNFITDRNLLASIVRASGVTCEDSVVEIGCGAGTLTREIAAVAKRVVAFELDGRLAPVLEKTLADFPNTQVVFSDFLKIDLGKLEEELGEYSVIANIPYYVTTPLITKLIEEGKKVKSITVMVQEEVARRLAAECDTPEYGAITAAIALRASASIIKRVPRTAFTPRPNVDSAVVRLDICDGRLEVKDRALYLKTVRAAFSSRRKTLENNLVNSFGISREQARAALSEAGIDIKARGETLSPEKFAALAEALSDKL